MNNLYIEGIGAGVSCCNNDIAFLQYAAFGRYFGSFGLFTKDMYLCISTLEVLSWSPCGPSRGCTCRQCSQNKFSYYLLFCFYDHDDLHFSRSSPRPHSGRSISFLSLICDQTSVTRKRAKVIKRTARMVTLSAISVSVKMKSKSTLFGEGKNPVPKEVRWSVSH